MTDGYQPIEGNHPPMTESNIPAPPSTNRFTHLTPKTPTIPLIDLNIRIRGISFSRTEAFALVKELQTLGVALQNTVAVDIISATYQIKDQSFTREELKEIYIALTANGFVVQDKFHPNTR